MRKIKITEKQANMLKEMSQPKVLKVTQEQYNKILEMENVQEDMLKDMIKSAPGPHRPQISRDLKKANPYKVNEMYEDFIQELYNLNESDPTLGEGKYSKLRKLMEFGGLTKEGRIVKEKFNNDKERVKQVISAGLYEMACGKSPYMAMEAIEEALKLSDITPDYFRKQIGEPNKSGKSREELMAAIEKKRKESNAITAAKEKEREDAIKALAQGEEEQKLDEIGDYPLGAKYDSSAPFNQQEPDYREGERVSGEFKIIGTLSDEIAILSNQSGEKFVLYYHHLPKDDFEPYVDIEKTYIGKDEDGFPDFEYDEDWEISDEAIESYVNDNLDSLSMGVGLSDYEDGKDLVKVDDELVEYLRGDYGDNVNSLLGLEEATTTGSVGGADNFFGYDVPMGGGKYKSSFWTAGNKENKHLEEGERGNRYIAEMDFYLFANDDEHAKQVAQQMAKEMDAKYDNQPRIQKLFKQPFGTMSSQEIPMNEDSHSETQLKGGSFVNVKEKCKKYPYCDEGPGAIETKKTKMAVVSNDHIVQEVAKKTGRTIEEVKKIISNFK
jgi:hypothetical protein